jgi:putative ABC transport system permease protein
VEVLSGALPASVLVGPAALAKGGLLHDVARPGGYVLVAVRPDSPDTADRPTTADRIALALLTSGRPASVVEQPSVLDPVAVVLAAGVAVTALMALLAGLMVTALALADGRADLMTFAAVGAPPGSRRRIAASSAGFVSLLGCVVGAAAGLLAARVLVPLLTRFRGEVFVTPWLSLALVVLAVPLLTAAVAFVTTRSRVVLTRRLDS